MLIIFCFSYRKCPGLGFNYVWIPPSLKSTQAQSSPWRQSAQSLWWRETLLVYCLNRKPSLGQEGRKDAVLSVASLQLPGAFPLAFSTD